MCDFSLQAVKSRPAVVGDKLVVKNFGTGTRGFAGTTEGDYDAAVCCLPGTELAFAEPIMAYGKVVPGDCKTAIFRQTNKEHPMMHHDCIELPDGTRMLLTYLCEGQRLTVLQLPVAPRNEAEAKDQERVVVVA